MSITLPNENRLEQGRVIELRGELHMHAHLCDHVLTAPEARAWAVLIPDYLDHCDVESLHARRTLASKYWKKFGMAVFNRDLPPEAAALVQGYVDQTQKAAEMASRLGWRWSTTQSGSKSPNQLMLGPSGVLFAWSERDQRFLSAFIPGLLYADAGNYPKEPRLRNPLPREGKGPDPQWAPAGGTLAEQRHDIFTLSVDTIRRGIAGHYNSRDNRTVDPLPRSELAFTRWETLQLPS